jgi:isopenicillin-N epimerase
MESGDGKIMVNLVEHFLLDPGIHFLNHGSFGATPRPVFEVYQTWQRELEHQPVEFLGRRHDQLLRVSRAALANYFHTQTDNIIYTQNVTISVNIVARSLKLGPGDEVLATDHEYGACDRTWRFLSRECGFKYIQQPISTLSLSADQVVEDFWKAVTAQTRVIYLSHISSPTAILFPVERIIARAKKAGIITIIDGAHTPGQIPLDLSALGADFYGGNLHKWLCAPKGAGFLYARPEVQDLLKPLVVSWGYESEAPSGSKFVDHYGWWGTRDISSFLSVPAAIEFQEKYHWETVRSDCHRLLEETLAGILEITGLPTYYPDDSWYVQMACAQLPSETDIEKLKVLLYEEFRVEVPLVAWNGLKLIRISIQGYNTPYDSRALLQALKSLLDSTT